MDLDSISILINCVLGIAVWGLKTAYNNLKDSIERHEQAIVLIRDTYFKKEDWLDFKEELWRRLDGMEKRFEDRVKELRE